MASVMRVRFVMPLDRQLSWMRFSSKIEFSPMLWMRNMCGVLSYKCRVSKIIAKANRGFYRCAKNPADQT